MNNTSNNYRAAFAAASTGTLWKIVKRDQYKRYGREFEAALDAELAVRNLRVS